MTPSHKISFINATAANAAAMFAAILLAGCGAAPVQDIIDGRKVDYSRDEYQESRALQYPPDVISAQQDSARLLSEYRIQAVPEISQTDEVAIDDVRKVSYRREGNLRWIDLDLPPDDAWILTKRFWDSLNFAIVREDADVGTMETDWLDLRQAPPAGGLGGFLDDFLERVRDSGERDKFIARVEGSENSSSIFVAHRRSSAKFDREGLFSGFAPLPPDSQLETEMLRRIMIFAAGEPEGEGEYEDAFGDEIAAAEEEGDDYELAGTVLYIAKPPAESWLLVRIGLDRGGFTIEDQDHAERAYYIQHSGGPESQQIFGKAETNFFNKLFGEEKPILREIKLTLSEESDGATSVAVEAADDEDELTEAQQSVLLELLSVNLP